MSVFVRVSAWAADRLITISEAARDDLVSTLGVDPAKIDVAPLGVRPPTGSQSIDPADLRSKLGLGDGPLVLCVAQKRPYKNLAALIHAMPALREEGAVLVLPGSRTDYEDSLRELASELGVADRIRFLGWVTEDELEALYCTATCFVLPSLVEGFGLPVLEAMAREVPVACSDRSALPEVVGDAALLFDPTDQDDVNAAIRRLLRDEDLRTQLVERGRERVACFRGGELPSGLSTRTAARSATSSSPRKPRAAPRQTGACGRRERP